MLTALAVCLVGAAPPRAELLADRSTLEMGFNPSVEYLVTPTRRVFRLVWVGPVTDTTGTKLGTKVVYLGDSRDHRIVREAASELIEAMGPQFQLQGESAVVVLDLLDHVPGRRFNRSIAYPIVFEFDGRRWERTSIPPEHTRTIGRGRLQPIDDPDFPLNRAGLAAAARVATRWMDALDKRDVVALQKDTSTEFSAKIDWVAMKRFLAKRSGENGTPRRRELYRLQTRNPFTPLPAVNGFIFLYEVSGSSYGRSLEIVAVARNEGELRVWAHLALPFARSR